VQGRVQGGGGKGSSCSSPDFCGQITPPPFYDKKEGEICKTAAAPFVVIIVFVDVAVDVSLS